MRGGLHPRAVGRGARARDVEVLAEVDGHPVAVRQDNILAVAFHPELTDDARVHALASTDEGARA